MEIEPNPHVALNNARNLVRTFREGIRIPTDFLPPEARPPSGTVIERPTGDLAALWAKWARGVEREAQAKKASNRKQRREQASIHPPLQ